MIDLAKLLEFKARHEADARKYAGHRPYYVEFYPVIRSQYFSVCPREIIAPWASNAADGMQEFVVSRMSRRDGDYRELFAFEVPRTAHKEHIFDHAFPMIIECLDAEIEALAAENIRGYLDNYLMDREMRVGAQL